jgi:septal ring factor EnvC (AmiA/AmiB activator)
MSKKSVYQKLFNNEAVKLKNHKVELSLINDIKKLKSELNNDVFVVSEPNLMDDDNEIYNHIERIEQYYNAVKMAQSDYNKWRSGLEAVLKKQRKDIVAVNDKYAKATKTNNKLVNALETFKKAMKELGMNADNITEYAEGVRQSKEFLGFLKGDVKDNLKSGDIALNDGQKALTKFQL